MNPNTQNIHDLSVKQLVSAKDAAKALGVSVSLFWRLNQLGAVPTPVYVTPKSPRWWLNELFAAMEARRKAKP